MSRPNPAKLCLILVGLAIGVTALIFLKGGIFTNHHPGDILHMIDIVLRMSAGQTMHIDFMTPLGWLGFAPIVAFLDAGFSMGVAFALAQCAVALLLIPPLVRATSSRLPAASGTAFAILTLLVVLSLGQGRTGGELSVSMFYNRWCWAAAFICVVLVVLPGRDAGRPWLDGAIVGVLMAAIAMVKVTYLVALAPVLALILVLRGERVMLLAALAFGALAGLGFLAVLGLDAMLAYAGDLLAVATGPIRQVPGASLTDIYASPSTVGETVLVLGVALVLRRKGRRTEGNAILLLFPAFTFITWQNFGNVPFWLIPVAAIFAAIWASERTLQAAGFGALATGLLTLPIVMVHAMTPIQNLVTRSDLFVRLVPDSDPLANIYQPRLQAFYTLVKRDFNGPGEPFEEDDPRFRRTTDVTFNGRFFEDCGFEVGVQAAISRLGAGLPAGSRVMVADVLSAQWLYGPAEPLPGGAPWNYGTLHGLDAATHLLVPACPFSQFTRLTLLNALTEEGVEVRETAHEELYTLYEFVR